MSPEWMTALDRMHKRARGTGGAGLRDPLEQAEWRGLDWVTKLISRVSRSRQSMVSSGRLSVRSPPQQCNAPYAWQVRRG